MGRCSTTNARHQGTRALPRHQGTRTQPRHQGASLAQPRHQGASLAQPKGHQVCVGGGQICVRAIRYVTCHVWAVGAVTQLEADKAHSVLHSTALPPLHTATPPPTPPPPPALRSPLCLPSCCAAPWMSTFAATAASSGRSCCQSAPPVSAAGGEGGSRCGKGVWTGKDGGAQLWEMGTGGI